jgi:DNA-binding MarR family transcriptional regulator
MMNSKADLEKEVLMAAAEYGINSVLFRNAMGRKLGLNITESQCLSLLGIKGISSPTELARYTGLTTGSTTTMLDRLERAGFITRRHNPDDRRGVLIEINSESAVNTAPLVAGVQKAHKELIASYSATELEIIADFLTRFTQNVKEHTKLIEQDIS